MRKAVSAMSCLALAVTIAVALAGCQDKEVESAQERARKTDPASSARFPPVAEVVRGKVVCPDEFGIRPLAGGAFRQVLAGELG